MSPTQQAVWCEALKLVPARWRGDLCRFVEEGEASDEFIVFLEQDAQCRRACEMVLRADEEMARLISAAAESEAARLASQ